MQINSQNTSIIIVTHNSNIHLKKLISCIDKFIGKNQEVYIVDNSSDVNPEKVINKRNNTKILSLDKNCGYACAINLALKELISKGRKYFLVLNPDISFRENILEKLAKAFIQYPDAGILGPKIIANNNKIWSCGGIIDKLRYSGGLRNIGEENTSGLKGVIIADYIPGTCMLFDSKLAEKINMFETDYFLYYEDADFSMKVANKGYKNYINLDAVIYHDASHSAKNYSDEKEYYMARNHLKFLFRFAPLMIKIREILLTPLTIYRHIKLKQKYAIYGIKDFYLGRSGKYGHRN